MSGDAFRDRLRPRCESVDVWCERCQRIHASIVFSIEDYDRVISEAAQTLSDTIDARLAAEIYDRFR